MKEKSKRETVLTDPPNCALRTVNGERRTFN
jgi:hypothetical protein